MATERRERVPLPRGFGSLWSVVALDLVGFGLVLPILPVYAERFSASPTTIGLLVASYSLAQFVCAPWLGRLSDRIGRRPVLVLALVGTAIGSLLTGMAHGLPLLFLGRLIDGASGASVAVAQAAVGDIASPVERPRLLGLLGAAFGVGFVLGPALGGVFALISPSAPFFVAAAIAGVNAVTAWFRLPETRRDGAGADRLPTGHHGVALGPLWRDSTIVGLVGTAFLALLAFSAFEATFSLFAKDELALSQSATYGVFTLIGLLIVLVQVRLVRPIVEREGEAGAVRAGLVLNGVGLLLLAASAAVGWAVAAPALAVLTIGQGLVTPTLTSALAGRVDASRRGRVLGAQQSAGALARVLGPFLGGALFQHVLHPAPYVMGALLVLVAVGVFTRQPAPRMVV
jgi:DHA1 family tetracycline resistance protein-like MFS transporter